MINNQDYKIADKEISLLKLKHKEGEKIKDESIVEIFMQSKKIIKKYFKNEIFLTTNQIPRGGKEYLNCERAFDIFENYKVMPEYCFSCYKVQIDPKNVLDLIKLYFLFDIMFFDKENLRKCMIDFRKDEKNYKGIIYCNTLEEARKINHNVEKYLKTNIDEGIKSHVKEDAENLLKNILNLEIWRKMLWNIKKSGKKLRMNLMQIIKKFINLVKEN